MYICNLCKRHWPEHTMLKIPKGKYTCLFCISGKLFYGLDSDIKSEQLACVNRLYAYLELDKKGNREKVK
jgi:hypothetical protein